MKSKIIGQWRPLLLALLLAALTLASGCGGAPDTVEDPLSQFEGGVDSLLPFATLDPSLVSQSPAPTSTLWDPNAGLAPTPTPAPAVSGYADLSYGDSGEPVSQMQGRLKALGYFAGTLDGKFGESTSSAVRLFQRQLGVSVTGIASAKLQEMLYSAGAPSYNSGITNSDPYVGDEGGVNDFDPYYPDEDYSTPAQTRKPSSTPKPTQRPSSSGYETLSRGDSGSAVSSLQRALKNLGYYSGTVDGNYGSGTVNAVKRFQKTYGQNQTGVATVALQKKLYSGDAAPYEAPATPTPKPTASGYQTLEWGDSGTAVKNLQHRLKALGYFKGTADGDYGETTIDAVMRFQKAIGVEQNGVASPSLQRKLYADSAPEYEPKKTPKPTEKPEYTTLRRGNTGEKVKALQRRLKELGYFDGDIGGNYLTKTVAAVKLFQKALKLEQTGVATASLQKKLFADSAPEYKPKKTPKPTATPAKYTTLQEGDEGKAVERLQQRLKDLGYYDSKITGGYGKNTTAAVKLFQKAIDVKETGVATASLQKVLFGNDAPSRKTPAPDPTEKPKYVKLKPGDTGDKVKELQRRLKELGYFDGDIGGNYLTKTETAVKAFQKALGVKQDGIATVDMQEKLFSADAPAKGEKSNTLKALKYKDEGDGVYKLQLRLIELGFMSDFLSDTQGAYGDETRQGVIDAQLARGFDSDGNADMEFMRFIMSDSAYQISRNDYERG